MPEILIEILKECLSNKDLITRLNNATGLDFDFARYGLGITICNKYLWFHQDNIDILSKFYNVTCVDDISSKIVDDFLMFINKK